jgi:hypothetical protein
VGAPIARLLAIALLAVALLPRTTSAAAGRYLALEELSSRATRVISGRVVSTRASWDDEMGRIITLARVAVDRTWRGSALHEVDLLVFGGAVGEIVQYVPGESKPKLGDHVLLFLRPIPGRDAWLAVGMRQGFFRKWPDGRWIRDFEGLHLLGTRLNPEASGSESLNSETPNAENPTVKTPVVKAPVVKAPIPAGDAALGHRELEFLSTPQIESLLLRAPVLPLKTPRTP